MRRSFWHFWEHEKSEDLGDGYKRIYNGTTWVNAGGENVDLTAVSANVTVTYKSAEVLVYKNIAKYDDNSGYKPVVSINKFIIADSNKIVRFKIRLNNASGTAFNIYESTGYTENKIGQWVEGDDLNKKWYLVEFDLNTGVCKIYNDGVADAGHTMTFAIIDINKISVVVGAGSVDVAAVNVEIVNMEFYDADKSTLLHSELVVKGAISYVHQFATDSEGYTKMVDTWLPIDGSANKMYAAKATYSKTTANPNLYNYVALSDLNKYVVANENGVATFKVKFTFNEWTSFKLFETAQSTKETMQIGLDVSWSGKWFTFELDTVNKTLKVTKPDGKNEAYNITSTDVSGYAFMRVYEKEFSMEVVNL